MNTIRQEFCDEINTPMGLDNEFDYIRWLEAKIQALRIHDIVGRSEQLLALAQYMCEHQNNLDDKTAKDYYIGTT